MTSIHYLNYIFTDNNSTDIHSVTGALHQSLTMDELASDELEFTVEVQTGEVYYIDDTDPDDDGPVVTSEGEYYCTSGVTTISDFEEFTYADPVSVYEDSTLICVFYVSNISPQAVLQNGSIVFEFNCLSLVGLMTSMAHDGGVYPKTGVTNAGELIAEILGATKDATESTSTLYYYNIDSIRHYTVDSNVALTAVAGWLPCTAASNCSARDNLRDVLFTVGASILKNADGSVHITFNTPTEPTAVADTSIYMGDTYSDSEKVTEVQVVEHSYYANSSTESEIVFDTGTTTISTQKVLFTEPYHSFVVSGLTLSSYGENWAIVSGSGTLSAKPYVDATTEHSKATGLTGASNVKTADCGLISAANYLNIQNRLANYYANAREVSVSLKKGSLGTGSLISFTDPLNRSKTGFIKDMNLTWSSFIKADSKVITNWVPSSTGNNFTCCDALTGSGTWDKSAAETRKGKAIDAIRVVLIASGSKGTNGADGADGENEAEYETIHFGNYYYNSIACYGGDGGSAGTGGDCGKVKQVDIESNVPSSFTYSAGASSTASNPSSATISGTTYSTNDGDASKPSNGYLNFIDNVLYCTDGADGIDGASGGKGSRGMERREDGVNDQTLSDAFAGSAVKYQGTWYGGGTGGDAGDVNFGWRTIDDITFGTWDGYGGGGGGGAAAGVNGTNGEDAYNSGTWITSWHPGDGGAGADAASPAVPTLYGCGGNGGNGGGGGGGAGIAKVDYETDDFTYADAGSGGSGSNGTNGAQGVVFVYY